MDDAFAAAIVGISTRAVTGRAGSPCVRATRGSGLTTTTRARCSRVETVEERRWWYSASRAGFWRVLGRVSLLSMSAPAVGSPEPREEITQLKVVLPRLKDLFCSVAKNAVAKNAHSDSANSLGLLFPDFNSANSLGLLFPDSDSANSLGRNSRRIRIQEPIKTAPDEPEENDVSKNVELNCWITTTADWWPLACPKKYFLCFPYQNDETPLFYFAF